MQNKLVTIVVTVLFTCLTSGVSVMAQEYGFLELYALAKAKDPIVGKARARLEVSLADQDLAWSALMPRISANASQRNLWHTVENYSSGTVDGSYAAFGYGVTGQLPIFNIPSYLQLSAADAGFRSAEASDNAARQDLIIRLASAYVALLKAQADEKLYQDELQRVREILKQSEAFLKAGTGDIIAVYEAKARMDSAAADLIKTEAARRVAEQEISSLTGINVSAVRDIPVSKPAAPEPNDINWWFETMQKNNHLIIQAKEDLTQATYYSSSSRAAHLPTIQFSGGYTVDKGSTFLPEVKTTQWYIGANVTLPIYSGGELAARTRRAVASESERHFMLVDTQDKNAKQLKQSFLNLQYNVSLVDAYRRKHESAELQLKAVRKGREIGTRTSIDLLNAEQTRAISRRDLNHALYDNILRHLELQAVAGMLTEEVLNNDTIRTAADNGTGKISQNPAGEDVGKPPLN